ncbi:alpha/beta hydrolase [Acaryochloris marina]|uniref:Monoacylglycerol lipase n=1 Tax=Acaryochloris marina (strain MBIC 11017) TaxID=329726 RepID=B0BZU9_ACAM1|nr:alpha/beta hydrolase [Acaryochloris marina]ABW27159.1 alpha/beta hydrolase fold [Acaryochloris marina MBIC11017]BDM81913.1 lysophospholipase [Acaryochloris marina MBIC10699]
MQMQSGYLVGAQQHTLYYRAWSPERSPQAVVAIVHGLGSHSNTFIDAVNALTLQGHAVYGLDLRGHGHSSGQRGYINHWSEFRADFHIFLQFVKHRNPDLPIFAWGHSLGGLIVLDYVLHSPQRLMGMMISGLPMRVVGISPWKLAIARLLSKLWPRFSLNTGIDPESNSRNPAVLLDHSQDSLQHTQGTARLATEFLRIQAELQAHAANLRLPLLMLHGSNDQTASLSESVAFFQKVGSKTKQHLEYPGAFHDLHADLDAQTVLADMSQWLRQQLTSFEKNKDRQLIGI